MKKKKKAKHRRITRGLNIKVVSFKRKAIHDEDFQGAVGIYDPDTHTAYINDNLPAKSNGSKELCTKHEAVHHRLRNIEAVKTLFGDLKKAELYVELEAITRTKSIYLSFGEEELKKILTNNFELNPNVEEDLVEIAKKIIKLLGVKITKKEFKEIISGEPHV